MDGSMVNFGTYDLELEAAKVFDQAALLLQPSADRDLNFPSEAFGELLSSAFLEYCPVDGGLAKVVRWAAGLHDG